MKRGARKRVAKPVKELPPNKLYHRCNPRQFKFRTTAGLKDITEVIGQDRPMEALQFSVGVPRPGFNLYALGPKGAGKHAIVKAFLERQAAKRETPWDWCYVNNFDDVNKPRALKLPAGRAVKFRQHMERLVEDLRAAISTAFEAEQYRTRRVEIEKGFNARQEKAINELKARAKKKGVAVLRTTSGFALAPIVGDKVLDADDFNKLPDAKRKRIEKAMSVIHDELEKIVHQFPKWQRETREKIRELNREVSEETVGSLTEDLKAAYKDLPEVVHYLDSMEKDVVENSERFRQSKEPEQNPLLTMLLQQAEGQESFLRRYKVNVLIDNTNKKGAPVIYEGNPNYHNLLGRVEHYSQMGALFTDFTLIKPGTLHRANGGYLMLDALKLLMHPFAWEGLKRALRAREIRIESPTQMFSIISTVSLEPEPIPLDIKVVLVGERLLYYLLHELDSDFSDLFKVAADFEETIDRSPKMQRLYARLIATIARNEKLLPFDREAVARAIEHGSRVVSDSEKLQIRRRDIADLLRESDHWARSQGRTTVTKSDVQQAIDARVFRSDRLRARLQEATLRGILLIDATGAHIGQVNGLSVIAMGGFAFGRPTRITARVRLGSGKVVDIEREVAMGGPIHSKGVLILSGFLAGRYVPEQPLSLSASLVFEQSVSGVEGDSASSAELYALLSALSQAPIKQSLAVTGSVNQLGQVQAIGGVNEKIEGFFDLCRERGLTGDQGVLIPASNVPHLMLRQDVIDAVSGNKFHIYPVETIDQGIELLTGVQAGKRGKDGKFPEGTINGKVEARLMEFAEYARRFRKGVEPEAEEK